MNDGNFEIVNCFVVKNFKFIPAQKFKNLLVRFRKEDPEKDKREFLIMNFLAKRKRRTYNEMVESCMEERDPEINEFKVKMDPENFPNFISVERNKETKKKDKK